MIVISTPRGYGAGTAAYPVLYLTDAETQLAHTVTTVDFLARNGRIPPLIVVGIMNTDRTRDLTPTRADMMMRGNAAPFPTSGGADKFLAFIETEVIPHVEKHFRVAPFRIFAGHSFGGLFAAHAMLSRPDLFHGIIAVSPTLMWDNELLVGRAQEFFSNRAEFNRTLFLSLGHEPALQRGFDQFKKVLSSAGASGFVWAAEQWEDEDHGSVVLKSHYAGLRKVFDGWTLPLDRMTGNFHGSPDDVDAHYRRLSARLGYDVLPPELVVNGLGYQALAQKRVDDALRYLELNITNHRESANAHDSFGEGLEAAGQFERALTEYTRAVELAQKSGDANLATFVAHRDALRAKVASTPSRP